MNRFLLAAFFSFVGIVLFAQTPYKTYCNLIGDENSLKKGIVSVIYALSFFDAMRTKIGNIPFAVFFAANTANEIFAITTKFCDTLLDTLCVSRVKNVPFFLIVLSHNKRLQ